MMPGELLRSDTFWLLDARIGVHLKHIWDKQLVSTASVDCLSLFASTTHHSSRSEHVFASSRWSLGDKKAE